MRTAALKAVMSRGKPSWGKPPGDRSSVAASAAMSRTCSARCHANGTDTETKRTSLKQLRPKQLCEPCAMLTAPMPCNSPKKWPLWQLVKQALLRKHPPALRPACHGAQSRQSSADAAAQAALPPPLRSTRHRHCARRCRLSQTRLADASSVACARGACTHMAQFERAELRDAS